MEAMFIPLLLFLLPQVYLGHHKLTGQFYAIKIIDKKRSVPRGSSRSWQREMF